MINIEKLWVRYSESKEYALKNISLKIGKGLNLVVGPTGSGKSTLARVLAGLIPSFYDAEVRGKVDIYGHNPLKEGALGLKGVVGFLPQYTDLFIVTLSVEEEIISPMSNLGVEPSEIVSRLEFVTKKLKLEDMLKKTTLSLSSGQLQLVAIASLLAMKPQVLLLDEPFSRLDPNNRIILARLLRELSEEATIIVFDHHIDEILPMANEVIIINNGEILKKGKPKELLDDLLEITDLEISFLGKNCIEKLLWGN